jgi:small conductance mechanosensitive channel
MFEAFDYSRLVPFALDLLGAIALLIVILWAAGWARRITQSSLDRSRLDRTLTRFAANVARYGVLVLGGLAVLSLFGISVASFAAILAAGAFAIGLAFQGTLSNFSAGVMLLVFRPFRIGDVVTVAGVTGKVVELDLFTTQFDTPDNRRLVVPNSEVFGSTIENVTFHPVRRVDVAVGTDYGADLRATRGVLEDVVGSIEGVLDEPAPQVYLNELGASSIDWVVRIWAETPNYWAVRERLTQRIKEALDAADIGIPFPQMDVHMDGVAVGAEASASKG